MKQLAKVVIVLLGIGVGILISYALTARAEIIVYNAPEIETKEVVVEVVSETEQQKVERLIREEFVDAPIMVEVARCESRFKNVPGELSDDFGPFQINQVHLPELKTLGLDRSKIEDNIRFARILYNRNGLKDWENSRHCWSK